MGRFLNIDPLAAFGGQDRYIPYAAMGNMPEMMVDPNGLAPGAANSNLMAAQAVTPEAWENPFARAQKLVMGGGNSAGATFGGGGGFAPGFTSQGMSAVMLNTFWDILPPMMKEQALIDYGSYGRQQQRKQDQNKVANKFRALVYAIKDGAFYLYITQNVPGDYTINGTESKAKKWFFTNLMDGVSKGTMLGDAALNFIDKTDIGRQLSSGTFKTLETAEDIAAHSNIMKMAKPLGKAFTAVNAVATGAAVINDLNNGRYKSATARAVVYGVATASLAIPVAGWAISAGIGLADAIWGDDFYNWL